MSKKLKKQLTGILISLVVIALAVVLDKLEIIDIEYYLTNPEAQQIAGSPSEVGDELYEVIRVVDGDTFIIEYNEEQQRVRLIGVDTPESVHPDETKNTKFGEEVSKFSKEMLTGKKVGLEFDVEQKDKYGRLLAYVYLDGQMYNKILLQKGYAKLATYPPNVKYVDDFTAIQKEARENKVGLWAY